MFTRLFALIVTAAVAITAHAAAPMESPAPEAFTLFVAVFDGQHLRKENYGDFSSKERCASRATIAINALRPRAKAMSWGCMAVDVDAYYVAQMVAYEATQDAQDRDEQSMHDQQIAPPRSLEKGL